MNFIDRIKRKLKRIYYNKKIDIRPRKIFDIDKYYKEIQIEENLEVLEKSIFLLSYDDTSMMKKSKNTFDYGGDIDGELNQIFFNFLEKYPYLKHTLFFVPNPNFVNEGLTSKTIEEDIHNIDKFSSKNTFISRLQNLEADRTIEISLHGYNHINTKIKDYYSAFEFEFLTSTEAKKKIDLGLKGLEKLFDIKGFKAPAWGMGQLSGSYYLQKVLNDDCKFDYVCLSSPSNGLNYEKKQVSYIYPERLDNLFNIPQNISILWELDFIYKVIDLIVEKQGIINIQLHYTKTHNLLTDGLCNENISKLSKIIEYVKKYDIDYLLHKEVKEKCKK